MKKVAPALMTVFLFVGALAVAQPHEMHQPPFMDIDKLAVLLDLNDQQKSEVDRVLKEQHEAAMAHRDEMRKSSERPSFEDMQAYHQQMVDDTVSKLQKTLSAKQIEKLKILMETPPMMHGGPHRHMMNDGDRKPPEKPTSSDM